MDGPEAGEVTQQVEEQMDKSPADFGGAMENPGDHFDLKKPKRDEELLYDNILN